MKPVITKYVLTPGDKYGMIGYAEVMVRLENGDKLGLRFKHVPGKDGKGSCFFAGNISVEENGEKKYLPDHFLDSRSGADELDKMLHERARQEAAAQAAPKAQPIVYPHGLVQNEQPSSMKEMAEQAELPF